MLYGNVPVKKTGWKAGAGPVGEVSGCRGAVGEQSPALRVRAGRQMGPLGALGSACFGAPRAADGAGGSAAASSAGKSSSLLHDVGVHVLSTWAADEEGLVSHWEAEEMEALSIWDSAKPSGMLSSVSVQGNGGLAK